MPLRDVAGRWVRSVAAAAVFLATAVTASVPLATTTTSSCRGSSSDSLCGSGGDTERMWRQAPFLKAISPRHGEIIKEVLDKATRDKLAARLDALPNGETWYADIYKKAIYGPMLFRDADLPIAEKIDALFPEHRILSDLYLEKTPADQGFPFHTDFDSNGFMEELTDMITVWIPLTPVLTPGSGQLSIVTEEGAVRMSLIRGAHQLHSLVCVVDKSVPEHQPFSMTGPEMRYLERTKTTPALDAGDALVFCNAFFHKSEDVAEGKRAAYILRLVRKDATFSRTRLLALKHLGQNLRVVNELLQEHFPDALQS